MNRSIQASFLCTALCTASYTAATFFCCAPAAAQWLQRTPAAAPSARWGAGMTFDANTGGALLFGGTTGLNNGQTWLYDGSNWTQLSPTTSPTPRMGHQLVYDDFRQVTVLYGGLASNINIAPPTNETWEWNGTNWTQVTPAANPGPRYRYGACFDFFRGRMVLFGGVSSQVVFFPDNQTWEYDGTNWTQVATTGNPGPRERPAMCYHPGIGKTVMFGGGTGSGLSNATWVYDGFSSTWTQLTFSGSVPAARNAATLVYDSVRNLCVLTGGQDTVGALSDTWTFDGSTWMQQPYATQGVRDHASAFLPTTKQVVKFGGFVAAPNTMTNSTWEFGSGIYGTGCPGTAGVPVLVAGSAPVIGQPYTLTASNLHPSINIAVFVVGSTQLPGIDLTFLLGMPGCTAFTTPDVTLLVVGAAGSASITWPQVTGALGDTFFVQALSVDPVNAFNATISNAVYATMQL